MRFEMNVSDNGTELILADGKRKTVALMRDKQVLMLQPAFDAALTFHQLLRTCDIVGG